LQDRSTDFEFLPIDVSLGRCQRYFRLLTYGNAIAYSTTECEVHTTFAPSMRASASGSVTDGLRISDVFALSHKQTTGQISMQGMVTPFNHALFNLQNFSGLTSARFYFFMQNASGQVKLDAEL
jgi:hypothetical protein